MKTSYDFSSLIYPRTSRPWHMSHAERCALLRVLEVSAPQAAIEIGTDQGGCLEQIRTHAETVYSIDINPEVACRLETSMPNVEFLTGPSRTMIPFALRRCAETRQELGFVLIDGDHRRQSVMEDIAAVLAWKPTRPLWILMHDSGNPDCRSGIMEAAWTSNPYVQVVDLDFVNGAISDVDEFRDSIWGGLAVALLLPYERLGSLEIAASAARNQEALCSCSILHQSLTKRVGWWIGTKSKELHRRLARSPMQ
jgi:hypothetical protein